MYVKVETTIDEKEQYRSMLLLSLGILVKSEAQWE